MIGPRDSKPVGSPEWCWQTLELVKIRWEQKDYDEQQWKAAMDELIAAEAWTKTPPGYPDLDALLQAEIGKTVQEATRELRKHGGDRKSTKAKQERVNQACIASLIYGTADYWIARLERDKRFDLLARIESGEFSPHAAALEAGYRKPPTPLDALQRAWRKASADERAAFTDWINQ